jgi:hypothetical protein
VDVVRRVVENLGDVRNLVDSVLRVSDEAHPFEASPRTMPERFEKKSYTRLHHRTSAELRNAAFVSCSFDGCQIVCLDFAERVRLEHIEAERCGIKNSTVWGAVFRHCRISHLRSWGMLRVLSCSFDAVTLTGRFDRLMIMPTWAPETKAFDAALAKEQAAVDWALDISGAEVRELDIRGIPADLIRRDEETQALVRASVVRAADWQRVVAGMAYFSIEGMLTWKQPSCVIVAPKRNKARFTEVMREIAALRKAGLAE